jgi:hypothetical protein
MILLSLLLEVIGRTLLVNFTNLIFVMVYGTVTNFYTYRKALHDFKFFMLDTKHWLLAILDSIRPWN